MKISLGRGATIKPGDNIMLWEGQRVKSRFANFRASPIAAPCQSVSCGDSCAADNWLNNPVGESTLRCHIT